MSPTRRDHRFGNARKMRFVAAVDVQKPATRIRRIGQAFAREQIEHRQCPELAPVGVLVGHEFHTPNVVPRRRLAAVVPGGPPSCAIPAQRQASSVSTIEALLPDVPAFPWSKHAAPAVGKERTPVCAGSRIRARSAVSGSRLIVSRNRVRSSCRCGRDPSQFVEKVEDQVDVVRLDVRQFRHCEPLTVRMEIERIIHTLLKAPF